MCNAIGMGALRVSLRGNIFRTTALAAALLGVYGTAYSTPPAAEYASSGSTINLDGVTVDAGSIIGAWSDGLGSKITALNGTTILTDGGKYGAYATAGGSIDLTGGSVTNTNTAAGSMGIAAVGSGSTITGLNVALSAKGENTSSSALSNVVSASGGANVALTGGSVTSLSSRFARGILASTGATVTTNGTAVSTIGNKSVAVHAFGASSDVSLTGIGIAGGTVSTQGDESYGLYAQHVSKITSTGAAITTAGKAGFGAFAEDGGQIILNGGSITTTGAALPVTGGQVGSFGVLVKDGGTAGLSNLTVTTGGDYANGVRAENGAINATNSNITTGGLWAHGAYATSGGTIVLDGGSVTTNNATGRTVQNGDGSRAYALYANGPGSSVATKNGTAIVTQGQRAYGAYATGGGKVDLTGGSINTNGFMAYGVYASGAGSTVTTHDVNITTAGNVGDAIWAYQGGVSTINGGVVSVGGGPNIPGAGETANGMTATGGTNGSGDGVVNVHNAAVTTLGADSAGALAGSDVGSTRASGTINLDRTYITVKGANSVAAMVSYGSTFTAANSSGLVSLQGDGISMNDNATVNLSNTTVQAKGASLVSNLNTSGAVQNITAGSGTTMTQNNGTLLQVNRAAAGMDGIVNLTLAAGSTSVGDVVDLDGLVQGGPGTRTLGGKTNLTVATGASWTGIVKGINDAATADNASATFNDATPIAGNVSSGSNSTITFTNGANIGGGVSTGAGTQGTFHGTTQVGGNVVTQGSTLAFNGPTTIGQGVSGGSGSNIAFNHTTAISQGVSGGSGSSFNFAGPTTIGQTVSGSGANFQFSKGHPTTIGGDVVLSDNSTLKGGTIGTPIQIQGAATVTSGSTLGGNLLVTGPLGGSGGTVSPGNSVGTQSYATSAGFTGAYKAEVNAAGNSDLIIIRSGNFDLSGIDLAVAQENGTGGYVLQHKYTIIQTPGGQVQNTFKSTALDASFANTLVKLDPVAYGAQDVQVSLSVDPAKVASARRGLSSNQNATLDGTISVAGLNASAAAALASTDTKDVLNQLSGEMHGSTQSALLSSGGQLVRTLSNRMRANLGAPMMAGAPVAQASGSMPAGAMPQSSAYPLWAQVVGDWQTFKGNDNTAKSSLTTGGLFVGGDANVGAGWRVGGALGFTNGRVDVNDRSSKSDLKSYTASLYGGKSWATEKGQINFLAGAGYTRYSVDSRRSVTVGGAQTLEANYHANATQLFTELGYAIPVGQASTIEPYVGLAWINLRSQGFDETGGAAALHGDSRTDSVSTMTLGLRGKTTVNVGRQTATLTAGLGWRLAGGNVNPERRLAFIQGNGAAFNVAGAPIARNAAVVDLGAEMAVGKNAALGLAYSGQFGAGNRDNTGSLYVKVRF